jgi:hypothetical protein
VPKESEIADVLGGLASLASPKPHVSTATQKSVEDVRGALEEFGECVRYLNTRRSAGAVLQFDSEAAVQDAIFLILRPWVPDLVPETPTEKTGNRYSIRDFATKALRVVIEAKFVRDRQHGKGISAELHDDIEVYRHNPNCDTIIFFIYDPDSNIPDERQLRRTIEQSRTYDGRPLRCVLILKP